MNIPPNAHVVLDLNPDVVHAATFDRMEAALSAALGEVPVDDPPKGESSWEGLLERVRRFRAAAENGATIRASVLAMPNFAHVDVDTDVALLRKAVLAAGRHQSPPRSRWFVVSVMLGHGSGVSWAICKALGLDPDEMVGTVPDEDDEEEEGEEEEGGLDAWIDGNDDA